MKEYKGFAYKENETRYKLFFGDSEKEILDRLYEWNKAHAGEPAYVYCNIGHLDKDINKYIKYQKFDVESGKNVSPIELKIPGLSKEEFAQTVRTFKEKGARFHPQYKRWYISPDNANMDYFKDFLVHKTVTQEQISEEYSTELLSHAQKIVQLDAKQMAIAEEKLQLMRELVTRDQQINGQISDVTKQILEAYHAEIVPFDVDGKPWVVYKQEQPERTVWETEETTVDRQDYLLSISKDPEDNRCTIYFKDGRLPVDLRGDRYNVHFPSMNENDTVAIVQRYLEKENTISASQQETSENEFKVGDTIDVYRPKITVLQGSSEAFITGVERICGTIEDITPGENGQNIFRVKEDSGYVFVEASEMYDNQQMEMLVQMKDAKFSAEKFNIVANPQLNHVKMRTLFNAFKDGLSAEQVKQFADPSMPSWQMDLHRYGMQHGLGAAAIKAVISSDDTDWVQSRQAVDSLIKERRQERIADLARQGYQADIGIIKKMEQIDCVTGKENSLSDICRAYKDGTYKDSPAGALVKDLGRQFQYQEMQQRSVMAPEL